MAKMNARAKKKRSTSDDILVQYMTPDSRERLKSKTTPVLDLYHELMGWRHQRLPTGGLCGTLYGAFGLPPAALAKLKAFKPYAKTLHKLTRGRMVNTYLYSFWGAEEDLQFHLDEYGSSPDYDHIKHDFGPFRQTILLFLAAQCGEL